MEALWYQPRRCWRVIVPRRLSETGKRCRRFFQTKAPRLAEDGNIRSDDWPVHGQIGGAFRPSSGVTFSQKSTSSRLQDGDEIPDADQRLVLLAFLRGQRSLGRFISQLLDPALHLLVGAKAEQRFGALSIKTLSDSGKYAFESDVLDRLA
jgi:hypothetical protein